MPDPDGQAEAIIKGIGAHIVNPPSRITEREVPEAPPASERGGKRQENCETTGIIVYSILRVTTSG